MNLRRTLPILILAAATILLGNLIFASLVPQTKDSASGSDINAIGHRNLGAGPNFYSLDNEKKLGKQLALEVERSSKLLDDPAVSEYISRVAQKIAQNSDARFPITIRIIDSDVMDAFTLPGGFQYINSGLILHTNNEAELAGALARGIAHTALRSSTREATKGELTQLAVAFQGPPGWAAYGGYQALNLANPVTYLKFRRDSESAADFYGLQYVYKSGYDPICFVRFLERAWPQTQAGANTPKVFGTFRPLTERLQSINKEIVTILPQRADAIVSSPEFQVIKERLRAWNSQKALKSKEDDQRPTLRKPTDRLAVEPPNPKPDRD
jgi:beta-barrel assembly-enhancing protease